MLRFISNKGQMDECYRMYSSGVTVDSSYYGTIVQIECDGYEIALTEPQFEALYTMVNELHDHFTNP